MSPLNDTDLFAVERSGTSYKVEAQNVTLSLTAPDVMQIERAGVSYKIFGTDVTGLNFEDTDLMMVERTGILYSVDGVTLKSYFGVTLGPVTAYPYTGVTGTYTVTTDVDYVNDGGVVFLVNRGAAGAPVAFDTVRGAGEFSITSSDGAGLTTTAIGFNDGSFDLITDDASFNQNGENYVAWTFPIKSNVFDIQTYTGNSQNGRSVAHNLGTVPGCIIVKRRNSTSDWIVYHSSSGYNNAASLNSSAGFSTSLRFNREPDDSNFWVQSNASVNGNGSSYFAYLFANDSANSKCEQASSGVTEEVGFEFDWLLVKSRASGGDWLVLDKERDNFTKGAYLNQTTTAEVDVSANFTLNTPTSFTLTNSGVFGTGDWNYVAVKRYTPFVPTGPVTYMNLYSGNGTSQTITNNVDYTDGDAVVFTKSRTNGVAWSCLDTVRGANVVLYPNDSNADTSLSTHITQFGAGSYDIGSSSLVNGLNEDFASWTFKGNFLDIVPYGGSGNANQEVPHDLGRMPGMIIFKNREASSNWGVSHVSTWTRGYVLNNTTAPEDAAYYLSTAPTTTLITLGNNTITNTWNNDFIAYVFAEDIPGVIKCDAGMVGTAESIGFEPDFLMIRTRTGTSDWFILDALRGWDKMVVMNDDTVETTASSPVVTTATGFTVPAGILSSTSFIYMAIKFP